MCGIYGIVFISTKKVKACIVRSIIRKLAQNSQARGSHATGLSFATKKGISMFKHNVSATDFLKLENTNQVIRNGVNFSEDEKVYSMIGHTRHQTQGSHMVPENNHPIKTGSIVGVHNGCVFNDNQIFEYLESRKNDKIARIAQVDSEAIFALINYKGKVHKYPNTMVNKSLVGNTGSPITAAIVESMPKIGGSLACAMQDANNLKAIWLFRKSNPLDVLYFKDEGLLIFASEAKFINNAVDGLDFSIPENIEVQRDSGICINVASKKFKRYSFSSYERDNTYLNY